MTDHPRPYAGPKHGLQVAVASWIIAERKARAQGRIGHADKLAARLDERAPGWRDRAAWLAG